MVELQLEYSHENLEAYLNNIDVESLELKSKHKISYFNVATSFDIESTSTTDEHGAKIAFVYIWQFDFNGSIIYGRTMGELTEFFSRLASHLELNKDSRRLIIYVHNLAHEFAFICKYFKWLEVFSIESRKPVTAMTDTGLVFKCSYLLTNMSLETVAKNLERPMRKLTGNLDYSLVRLSITPITPEELAYCLEDVKIVVELIREKIKDAKGDITKIPLTATGYVREAVRKNCLYDYKKGDGRQNKHGDSSYSNLMRDLTLEPDEYILAKRAFMGGFTHANSLNANKTLHNVFSYDITSSYPAVMVSERYPMGKGKKVIYQDKQSFENDLKSKCMIFELWLKDVELINKFGECYLSSSKCDVLKGAVINNGRVAKAKELETCITNIDFQLIRQIYTFSEMKIKSCYVYKKDFLPSKFISSILDFYVKKTTLKGVVGKEKEYMASKSLLNSCYGMCVTDIVRDDDCYDNELGWSTTPANVEKQITSYNNSKKRFLFYPWGVFVTAYARRNLFALITQTGDDFIYSDTDSVKFLNKGKHLDFIKTYNENITKRIQYCLRQARLDPALAAPVDINGVHHPLGVYDCETLNGYECFKTVGAKRYMYMDKGDLHITIAGVNKKAGAKYLASFKDPFEMFTNNLFIPSDATGKLTHTYLDNPMYGVCTDYLGNTGTYESQSGVHLSPTEYSLTISDLYYQYFTDLQSNYFM